MIVVAEIFSFHVSRRVFILRAAMLLFSLTYFRHTENKTATRKPILVGTGSRGL
jgi:hypothetical protein